MLKRIYRHLDELIEVYLASAALILFAALVVAQVFMRYVVGASLTWSEELARFALVWFVWIAGSYAVRYQRHVKFSILVNAIGNRSPITRRIIGLAVFLLWLAFLILMLLLSSEQVIQQFNSGQVAAGTRLPVFIPYLGLPLGMLLMTFRVAQHLAVSLTELVRNPRAPIQAAPRGVG